MAGSSLLQIRLHGASLAVGAGFGVALVLLLRKMFRAPPPGRLAPAV